MGQCPFRPLTYKSSAHHQTNLKRESQGMGAEGKRLTDQPGKAAWWYYPSTGATGRITESVLGGCFYSTDYCQAWRQYVFSQPRECLRAFRGEMKEQNGQVAGVIDLSRGQPRASWTAPAFSPRSNEEVEIKLENACHSQPGSDTKEGYHQWKKIPTYHLSPIR